MKQMEHACNTTLYPGTGNRVREREERLKERKGHERREED